MIVLGASLFLLAACSESATDPLGVSTSGRLEGRVQGPGGEPIEGAVVSVLPVGPVAGTGADGSFALHPIELLEGVPSVTVRVARAGYEPFEGQVGLSRDTPEQTVLWTLIPVDGGPAGSVLLVSTSSTDEVMCVAEGDELGYEVRIANGSTDLVPEVVLHDTLDGAFARPLAPRDIAVNEDAFPTAEVTLSEDGRSFRVDLGTVGGTPDGGAVAYTVSLPARQTLGLWCNAVAARGAGGTLYGSDRGCITTTLVIAVELVNEDGRITAGVFDPSVETFQVGDGGPANPDDLVLRVRATNEHCYGLTDVVVTGTLTGSSIRFRSPASGYPNAGGIAELTTDSVAWEIGELPAGATVELRLHGEATAPGVNVHRIELAAAEIAGGIIREEPVTVAP